MDNTLRRGVSVFLGICIAIVVVLLVLSFFAGR